MSSFEFEGKNVDKAVQKACKKLNLAQDEIKYDVLSQGSSGIFGFAGGKKAKIRVDLADEIDDAVSTNGVAGKEIENSDDNVLNEEPSFQEKEPDYRRPDAFEQNHLEIGRNVLQRIIDSITSDAKISVEENSRKIFLNVTGGNAALLIGKKGQTLEAIQTLVEKVVNKKNNSGHRIRVQVDVEGYLETRKANLEGLAARMADKSKRIRKPISMGRMSAYDRRIVHMALKNNPDVRTQSKGEGFMRKLVIFPQKNSTRRQ